MSLKNAPLTLMKYKCFFAGYQKPAKLGKFKYSSRDMVQQQMHWTLLQLGHACLIRAGIIFFSTTRCCYFNAVEIFLLNGRGGHKLGPLLLIQSGCLIQFIIHYFIQNPIISLIIQPFFYIKSSAFLQFSFHSLPFSLFAVCLKFRLPLRIAPVRHVTGMVRIT